MLTDCHGATSLTACACNVAVVCAVQEKIASKVSAAATNKTVQKKVGKMVRDFAENEDAQKKAASFLGSMIKSAASRD
mgnify:CR=1 FL=1